MARELSLVGFTAISIVTFCTLTDFAEAAKKQSPYKCLIDAVHVPISRERSGKLTKTNQILSKRYRGQAVGPNSESLPLALENALQEVGLKLPEIPAAQKSRYLYQYRFNDLTENKVLQKFFATGLTKVTSGDTLALRDRLLNYQAFKETDQATLIQAIRAPIDELFRLDYFDIDEVRAVAKKFKFEGRLNELPDLAQRLHLFDRNGGGRNINRLIDGYLRMPERSFFDDIFKTIDSKSPSPEFGSASFTPLALHQRDFDETLAATIELQTELFVPTSEEQEMMEFQVALGPWLKNGAFSKMFLDALIRKHPNLKNWNDLEQVLNTVSGMPEKTLATLLDDSFQPLEGLQDLDFGDSTHLSAAAGMLRLTITEVKELLGIFQKFEGDTDKLKRSRNALRTLLVTKDPDFRTLLRHEFERKPVPPKMQVLTSTRNTSGEESLLPGMFLNPFTHESVHRSDVYFEGKQIYSDQQIEEAIWGERKRKKRAKVPSRTDVEANKFISNSIEFLTPKQIDLAIQLSEARSPKNPSDLVRILDSRRDFLTDLNNLKIWKSNPMSSEDAWSLLEKEQLKVFGTVNAHPDIRLIRRESLDEIPWDKLERVDDQYGGSPSESENRQAKTVMKNIATVSYHLLQSSPYLSANQLLDATKKMKDLLAGGHFTSSGFKYQPIDKALTSFWLISQRVSMTLAESKEFRRLLDDIPYCHRTLNPFVMQAGPFSYHSKLKWLRDRPWLSVKSIQEEWNKYALEAGLIPKN